MNLLSCTCSVYSRPQGFLKLELACGSRLIALTDLSSISLSKMLPFHLYFQPLQHIVSICSTIALSVAWKSCVNLAWVQYLWSRPNRCLLSKASLCCITLYSEGIHYFLLMKPATSHSKWSSENSFALNRDHSWQTFMYHLSTTCRTASYGTPESAHYWNWHCSLSLSWVVLFDQTLI